MPSWWKSLAQGEVGDRIGLDYDVRVRWPDNPDLVTEIARTVDNGVPVPLGVRAEWITGHQMVVIDNHDGYFQIYNPWGTTFWVSHDSFMHGELGLFTPGPWSPIAVHLPDNG